jgi:hypothetical protein
MIDQQVAEGYDYVKIMIEDGTVVGHPGLPVISGDVLAAAGARADLLLVDGDPTTTIADTLSIRAVWRRGARQTPA